MRPKQSGGRLGSNAWAGPVRTCGHDAPGQDTHPTVAAGRAAVVKECWRVRGEVGHHCVAHPVPCRLRACVFVSACVSVRAHVFWHGAPSRKEVVAPILLRRHRRGKLGEEGVVASGVLSPCGTCAPPQEHAGVLGAKGRKATFGDLEPVPQKETTFVPCMHSGKEHLPRHDILALLDEHLCEPLASEGGARVDVQDVKVVQLHRLKGKHRRSLVPDGNCLGVRGGHEVRGMWWQRKQRDVRSGELASVLAL